jgi:hypothetical protein
MTWLTWRQHRNQALYGCDVASLSAGRRADIVSGTHAERPLWAEALRRAPAERQPLGSGLAYAAPAVASV